MYGFRYVRAFLQTYCLSMPVSGPVCPGERTELAGKLADCAMEEWIPKARAKLIKQIEEQLATM